MKLLRIIKRCFNAAPSKVPKVKNTLTLTLTRDVQYDLHLINDSNIRILRSFACKKNVNKEILLFKKKKKKKID